MTEVSRLSLSALRSIALATSLLFTHSVVAREDLSSLTFHPTRIGLESHEQATRLQQRQAAFLDTAASAQTPPPGMSPVLSVEDQQSRDGVVRFDAAISTVQQDAGPYALELAELLQGKGMLLQNLGEHDGALDAFEQSMHVMRVNQGLYSPEQIPVLRAMIQASMELGDVANAHALQEALFHLQLKHYGTESLAATNAYIEWADWNARLYLDYEGLPGAEQVEDQLENPALLEAFNQYANALELLQSQQPLPMESMVTTERKLAAITFIVRERLEGAGRRNTMAYMSGENLTAPRDHYRDMAHMSLFNQGSSALRRAISYSINAPEPQYAEIAERVMELGDWYLLFDRRATAIEMYEDALTLIANAEISDAEKHRLLASGLPVQTPAAAYQAGTEQPGEYAGYIDVAFKLNKFGMAYKPEILGATHEDQRIERELLRTIRSCKFRPAFAQGTVVGEDRVQLRYYYTL